MATEDRDDGLPSRHIRDFAAVARRLFRSADFLADGGARVDVLINPASGLLKRGPGHRRMMRYLRRIAEARRPLEADSPGPRVRFHETESRAHAGDMAVALAHELAASEEPGLRLLVAAGGDGFHNDIVNALLKAEPDLLDRVVLFTLPMGSGNDNADGLTVEEAFARLGSARGTRKDAVVEVRTARGGRHYAHNTASFGLDAYVCELSNRMKNLAGPSAIYKIFADVAVLAYEKKYPLQPWSVVVEGPDGTIRREGRYLMNVMGRRGYTDYGGGMKVLPGDENYLLIEPLSLMSKLKIKPLFYRGAHRGLPVAEFFRADRVTLDYPDAILMELDGEVVPLRKEDFPLTMTRVPDALTLLAD